MSDRLADAVLWTLVDVSIRWGLLIVALGVWFAIRPPRRTATRSALCVAALLAGPALAFAPRWDAYVFRAPPSASTAALAPGPIPDFSRIRPLTPAQVEAIETRVAFEARRGPRTPAAPVDWPRIAARTVVAAWLFGMLTTLVRLALGMRALRRWVRAATPATADDRALWDACREALPTSRPVLLARHPEAASPVMVGGLRPIVALPDDWDAWPVDRRRAAMIHELAHVRRYDDVGKLLEELLRAPSWFHPAVAWLLARIDRERELLCDEAVVAVGDDPRGLARLLLDLSRGPAPRPLPSASLPFLDRRATAIRIQRLLEDDMPRTLSRPSLARALMLGSTALAVAVGLGALRVRSATARESPTPPAKPAEAAAPPSNERPTSIDGVVVDSDDAPIEGATVAVFGDEGRGRRLLTTDAEGKFSTSWPGDDVRVFVVAAKPGLAPGSTARFMGPSFRASGERGLVVKLARPAAFAVTIVDERDRPIPGATIRVVQRAEPGPAAGGPGTGATSWIYPPFPRGGVEGTPIDRHLTATAAADGSCTLPEAAAAGSPLRFEVATADGRPRVFPLPKASGPAASPEDRGFLAASPGSAIRVKTLPASRIEGKVVSKVDGVDLSKLRAWCQASQTPQATPNFTRPRGEAPVAADGRFVIDGLQARPFNVYVAGAGEGESWTFRALEGLEPEAGQAADATIELIPGVEVSGTVMSSEGASPVAAAVVGVYGPSNPKTGPARLLPPTGADGRYRVRLPAGESSFYVLKVEGRAMTTGIRLHPTTIPRGVARFDAPTLRVEGEGRDATARPGPPPGVKSPADVAADELAGVVVDEAGKPIEGALVDAWTWHEGNETKTDARGFFRLGDLGRDRKIEVRISREGRTPALFVQRPTGQPDWVVVLGDKTYFEGRATAPDGKPAADVLVRANCGPKRGDGVMIGEIWSETRTDADGRYRLYTQADVYDVQVRAPGVGVFRRSGVALAADQAQRLDLPLEAGATFQARVVDSLTGKPVPKVRLFHWQHPGVEGTSDADGDLAIRDMLPGPFQFSVEAPGYARWWSEQASTQWSRPEALLNGRGLQRNFDRLDFELSPGMAPVTITVEPAVTVIGRVLDPDGEPVAGATATAAKTGSGNSLTGDTRFSEATAADGSFTLKLPASGDVEYNLVAHDGKYQEWRNWANGVLPPMKTKPGQTIRDVEIRLTRPAAVKGRVTTADGKPAARVAVRASAADRLENRYYDPTAETAEDGTYELKFIRPGEQFVQIAPFWLDARQAPKGTSRTVKLAEGEAREGVDFRAGSDRRP